MQQDSGGNKYDCRTSQDDPTVEYTISFNAKTGEWHVNCWKGENNHWHVNTRDETKALFEFNRMR